jgi:aminopeptidase N
MRRPLVLFLGLLTLGFSLTSRLDPVVRGQQPALSAEPLRTAGERPIDIRNIRLDLKVDLPGKVIDARATLTFRSLRRLTAVGLDAVEFKVHKVTLVQDQKETNVPFSHDGKKLVLDFNPALADGADGVLRIDYRIKNPRAGLHFFGPSKAEPDVPLTVWSHGEPISNRHWIPCLDQPNQRQSTELVVTVAEGFDVLSNGALVSKKADPGARTVTFHWRQEKPHPSYLVTLVVGQFDVVEEKWDKLPVLYYVPRGRKADVARTFGRTREMLDFFSRRFGVAYPWEKYAQVVVEQFNSGGMENTSATTLTDGALHDERSMLDSSPDSLISHEMAHQWWGDLVTCRDWSHLWLNEGFASYAEALWDEHKLGADAYAATMLGKSRAAITGGRERPMVDRRYPFPRSMFDARSYPKGAFVLHMLRQRLGEDAFWKGIQQYGKEHRFRSVETSDFRKVMERVSGRDLERFFHDWAERPGSPVLEVASAYNAESRAVRLVIKQTQAGEPFHFPLALRFGFGGARPAVVVTEPVTDKETRVTVPLGARPLTIEIDPLQAVLAEVKETKGRDLWSAQLAHGNTVVSRVRAAEWFGKSKEPADRAELVKALAAEKFWAVQVEIANALGGSGGEVCRDALLAGLKHEHPKVRRACATQLRRFPRDAKVAAALKEVLTRGDASYFVEAAALSSYARQGEAQTASVLLPWLAKPSFRDVLRTAALGGLGETRDVAALDPLLEWTKRGKSRANRMAALSAVAQLARTANLTAAQRDKVLAALTACLEGETLPVRLFAVRALQNLGPAAAPALPALEAVGEKDADERVADAARRAVAQINKAPAASAELLRMRDELERLKRNQEVLLKRLEKYEKSERR